MDIFIVNTMKPRFLLIFCSLFSLCVSAQEVSYVPYYKQIMVVEESLAERNFDKAVDIYAVLFASYERPFARDAFNACQLAALRDSKFFEPFFLECAKAGVRKEMLVGNKQIGRLYRVNAGLYDQMYDEGYAVFRKRIDTALREEFVERYELEQQNKGNSNYKQIVYDNFNRIMELAKQGLYPGEYLIGSDELLNSYYTMATLLHYPYSYLALQPYFDKAIEKGKVQPRSAVYVYCFNQSATGILYAGVAKNNKPFSACYNMSFGKDSKDIEEVNRQRRMKYLPSVEVEKKVEQIARANGFSYLWGY